MYTRHSHFIPDWKQAPVLVEVDVHFLMMWHVHIPVYKSRHVVCVCVHEKMCPDFYTNTALGAIKAVCFNVVSALQIRRVYVHSHTPQPFHT